MRYDATIELELGSEMSAEDVRMFIASFLRREMPYAVVQQITVNEVLATQS